VSIDSALNGNPEVGFKQRPDSRLSKMAPAAHIRDLQAQGAIPQVFEAS
jgi:hypothetical protein